MFQSSLAMLVSADVNARDNEGFTLLHHAVCEGNSDEVKNLLDHGANTEVDGEFSGDTPLYYAASAGNSVEIVKILLEHGANPNVRMTAELGYDFPLHEAARTGDKDVVLLLLAFGANPCAKCGATWLGSILAILSGERNQYTACQMASTEECKNVLQLAESRRRAERVCVIQ